MLALTALLILLLALFIRAGFWQLDRAEEKRSMLAAAETARTALPLNKLISDADASNFRQRLFVLRGSFVNQKQILLDNMTTGGSNGYEVLTPFRTSTGIVLVNRGWLRANPDRNILPEITVSESTRVIRARLMPLPQPGVRLAASQPVDDAWPKRMLFPTREQLVDALGESISGYQLHLEPDEPDGYVRAWPILRSGPEKHFGYALQWFSFAVLAVVFYVLILLRDNRARAEQTQQPE